MAVNIRPMTNAEFDIFCQWSATHQAEELMEQSPISYSEALAAAKEELAQMLPGGLRTENHCIMTITETSTGENVGFIWTLHEQTNGRKQSFLCDFAIWEEQRRKGYGTAALQLVETAAAEAGCQESVLFLADKNIAAKALYEKCGYRFLRQKGNGRYMIKQLP